MLRVAVDGVVHGKSADLPICWIYYHVADEKGRQAALTFTVEQKLMEQFAESDRAVIDSLRFVKSADARTAAKPE